MAEQPPTLQDPYEPTTSNVTNTFNVYPFPEDDVRITREQMPAGPRSTGIKVNDGENIQMVGIDMGGQRIFCIGRHSFHLEGNKFDASDPSSPEGDVNSFQTPNNTFRPTLTIQLGSYGPSKGTRLSHKTVLNGSIENETRIKRITRLTETAFEIVLEAPFPEQFPDGQAPAEILAWNVATDQGVILDNQGWNWPFAVVPTSDPLRYTATISNLGEQDWEDGWMPDVGKSGFGGMAVLSSQEQGEHNDGIYQVNDGSGVQWVSLDRIDAWATYQLMGNTGAPPSGYVGGRIRITRTSAEQVLLPPQQPKTFALYVKGTPEVEFGFGVTIHALNDRPISKMAVFPPQDGTTYDTTGEHPVLTFAEGRRYKGQIVQRRPAVPNAPLSAVGANYKRKGEAGHIGWLGYVPATADMIQDITLSSTTVAVGTDAGSVIGIIRVITNKPGEIIDTVVTGSAAMIGKLRKRLLLAANGVPGSYPIRITAYPRGTDIAVSRDFTITIS